MTQPGRHSWVRVVGLCGRGEPRHGPTSGTATCWRRRTHYAYRGDAAPPPRYGYRSVWALLCREGWAVVNLKRAHRLWREAQLHVGGHMSIQVSDYPRLIVGSWATYDTQGNLNGEQTFSSSGGSTGTCVHLFKGTLASALISVWAAGIEVDWSLSGNQIQYAHVRFTGGIRGLTRSALKFMIDGLGLSLKILDAFESGHRWTETIQFTDKNHFTSQDPANVITSYARR